MLGRFFTSLLLIISLRIQSQVWTDQLKDPTNFYDIRNSFLSYNKNERGNDSLSEDDELTKFHRWEYIMEPRVYPSGQLPTPDCLKSYMDFYFREHPSKSLNSRNKTWGSLEPDSGFQPGGNSGRVNCLAFHPIDSNTIFIGTPAGGMWKSTNAGISWQSLTDQIPAIGVSEIVVDPQNPDIIYIATGDRDAANFISNPYSYGILKSIDGGRSWDTTGLQFMVVNQMSVSRLIIHPKNSNILLAAIKSDIGNFKGIWRTEDGGKHWTNVSGGAKYDVEFHPTNPDIVYTCGYKNIQKSTDGGKTWAVINSPNLPAIVDITSSKIAVSVAAPNQVFVQYIGTDGNTNSLYKSSDAGVNWSRLNSFSITTQSAYDFDFAVSPIDTNTIILGGQMLYTSTNGGKNFTQKQDGHLDHHGFYFRPNSNTIYDCNDGGLYVSNNVAKNWINLNKALHTFQYYRLGCSQLDPKFILTGAQDNGTVIHLNSTWTQFVGGDGMECAIDPLDDQIYYASYQYGNFIGNVPTFFNNPPNAGSQNYAWIAPFLIHPKKPKILFAGGKDVYISQDRGANWNNYSTDLTLNDPVGGGFLRNMAISPSDPDHVMYAISYVVVYKTEDSGKNWKIVTSNLPTTAGCLDCSALSSILVHPDNPNIVWVTFSGYSKNNRVFQTLDGGISWNNISGSLPAIPVNTIAYEKNNDDAIYIGTDIGVFFRNNQSTDWESFMDGLPRVPIQELEVVEPFHKIRAATFGRGLWEAPLKDVQVSVSQENDSNASVDIEIYPNPTNQKLIIKTNKIYPDFQIRFIETDGKELYRHIIKNKLEEIKLPSNFSKILYYQVFSKNDLIKSGGLKME